LHAAAALHLDAHVIEMAADATTLQQQ